MPGTAVILAAAVVGVPMALQDMSCSTRIERCARAVAPLVLNVLNRRLYAKGELSQLAVWCVLKLVLQHRALQHMPWKVFNPYLQSVPTVASAPIFCLENSERMRSRVGNGVAATACSFSMISSRFVPLLFRCTCSKLALQNMSVASVLNCN